MSVENGEGRSRGMEPADEGATKTLLATSKSAAMCATHERTRTFAAGDETVLIQGESGTGKTGVATLLHSYSPRAKFPFLYLNLAGLDDGIASSELFGYVRGAFTDAKQPRKGMLAETGGGTILLDEIGKSSLPTQRKLLDVLERKAFRPVGADRDVRLHARMVFAASESLETLVQRGEMLRDFLPRLGLFRIVLPPLRQRREDVPDLLNVLLRRHAGRFGFAFERPPRPTDELVRTLAQYDWPGNVRELEAVAMRLLNDARGSGTLSVDLLTDDLAFCRGAPENTARSPRMPTPTELRSSIKLLDNNKSAAARRYQISRTSVWRILRSDSGDGSGPGTNESVG